MDHALDFNSVSGRIPVLAAGLIVRETDDGNMNILNLTDLEDRVFVLKGEARDVVRSFRRSVSWSQIEKELRNETGIPQSELKGMLFSFARWLYQADLVRDKGEPDTVFRSGAPCKEGGAVGKRGSYEVTTLECLLEEMPISVVASSRIGS